MSVSYQGVLWNRQKRIYDVVIASAVVIYLLLFVLLNEIFFPSITPETLLIRATGTLALLMLHVILSIGPLSRIDKRFLVLLYNRRHLGVTMFLIALIHGVFNIAQFHSLGNINPFVSIFLSNTHYNSFINFPFQVLGFFALIIFMLMAVTSHDFWLANLSPRVWKSLHMMVYVAYTLIIFHVMLGVIQLEHSPVIFFMLMLGMCWLIALHFFSARKEWKTDHTKLKPAVDGFIEACDVNEIIEKRAKIISANGERIAIFKYDGKISAVSNVCKHQHGPLGEGKIIDGCITCPWHGYQYKPDDGCSPPPFKEKVSTFNLKLIGTKILINPIPNSEGTYVEPIRISEM